MNENAGEWHAQTSEISREEAFSPFKNANEATDQRAAQPVSQHSFAKRGCAVLGCKNNDKNKSTEKICKT